MSENSESPELQQDLSQVANHPGMVAVIHFLFENKVEIPSKEAVIEVMNKHLGNIEVFSHSEKVVGMAAKDFSTFFEEEKKTIPAQLLFTECMEVDDSMLSDLDKTQLWECKNSAEILEKCKYHIVATDMMAACLHYKDRASMLVKYIEAIMELFPECKAFVFDNSKKMISREIVEDNKIPENRKFITYAVNTRFFNIAGTSDMMVDTVGMSTLFQPDLQYHFHGVDPNSVVNHALNMITYMFDNDVEFKNNDKIDGVKDGKISPEVMWSLRYEDSLIQPLREVLDINMGEFASGTRQ